MVSTEDGADTSSIVNVTNVTMSSSISQSSSSPPLQSVPLDEAQHKGKEEGLQKEASSDSEDAMYSVGSTPAGTPVRVPKGEKLTEDECELLVQMESQMEYFTMKESYESRIQQLENEKSDLESQIKQLDQQLRVNREEFERNLDELKKSFTTKLDKATKQSENARKDLESMVIKYAMSEKQIIDARKSKDIAEQKVRDFMKEKESLLARIKALTTDKTSLTSALDRKITDHATSMKEIEKLQNELKQKESSLKQTQQKLQSSMNSHNELKEQIVNLNNVMDVLKKELEECKLNTNRVMEHEQQVDEESQQLQVLERKLNQAHETEVRLQTDIESLKTDHLRQLEDVTNRLKEEQNKLTDMFKARDYLESKVAEPTKQLTDLSTELDTHRHREEEMNDLNERLKERISLSQSEINLLQVDNNKLKHSMESLKHDLDDAKTQIDIMSKRNSNLERELQEKESKFQVELLEKQRMIDSLKSKVDELENDKKILSKKHELKEINKELTQLRKRQTLAPMSTNNSDGSNHRGNPDTLSMTSRTRSSSSLDMMANQAYHATTSGQDQHSNTITGTRSDEGANGPSSMKENTEGFLASLPELSKESLLEKILRLQKLLAKRSERIDFLEDHNHQLVEELKKKTRLIQYYLLREESGALTTSEMDSNKRELVKKGATTMSSLFQNKNISESDMTLELSLEINRKLQAVLEDTILKNMMLKESLSTLGEEVARLSNNSMSRTSQK